MGGYSSATLLRQLVASGFCTASGTLTINNLPAQKCYQLKVWGPITPQAGGSEAYLTLNNITSSSYAWSKWEGDPGTWANTNSSSDTAIHGLTNPGGTTGTDQISWTFDIDGTASVSGANGLVGVKGEMWYLGNTNPRYGIVGGHLLSSGLTQVSRIDLKLGAGSQSTFQTTTQYAVYGY